MWGVGWLGLLVAWLVLPSGAAAQGMERAAWVWGLEMSPAPAAFARWETGRSDWIFGVGGGLGLGGEHVRVRATPSARIGRALPAGFRVDGGLGFEWARLDRDYNEAESEVQWEVTGGWSWASVLRAEAGLRWTDYDRRRTEGIFRLALEGAGAIPPARSSGAPSIPHVLPDLGTPPTVTSEGRVHVGLAPPTGAGSGVVLAAANPRGDPAPGTAAGGDNIDRLGGGAEAWYRQGGLGAWLRWRSDLHTDPSIRERVRPIAEGLSFPVSISFSGGARLTDDDRAIGVELRHDPQTFLWMPHLAAERTAEVHVVNADAAYSATTVDVRVLRLASMPGRTIEPLSHTLLRVRHGQRTSVGAEHERSSLDGRLVTRSRAVVERSGAVFGRIAAGDDVVLRVGGRAAADPWHAEVSLGYRSRPDLLDYDALLARGWHRPAEAAESLDRSPMFEATGRLGRGPFALSAAGFWGDPMWVGENVRRGHGGHVDAVWADTLAAGRIEGTTSVRLAHWGSAFGWWREAPGFEGVARLHVLDGTLRMSAELAARSALVSARSGLDESAGAELGIALAGPLPPVGPLRGMSTQARLEDVFDRGLPTRVGAPRRGRRLVLLVTLISGDPR